MCVGNSGHSSYSPAHHSKTTALPSLRKNATSEAHGVQLYNPLWYPPHIKALATGPSHFPSLAINL